LFDTTDIYFKLALQVTIYHIVLNSYKLITRDRPWSYNHLIIGA